MGVEVWREYHLHTAAQSNKSPRVFLTSGYSCTRFFKENKYRNDVFLSGAKPKLMLKLTAFSVGRAVRNTVCMLLPTPQAVIFCCLLTSAAALNLYEQTGSCAAALLPAQLFLLLQSSANWPFFSPPHQTWRGLFLQSCSYLTVCYLRSSVSGARRPDLYLSRRIRCWEASWSLALSLLPGLYSRLVNWVRGSLFPYGTGRNYCITLLRVMKMGSILFSGQWVMVKSLLMRRSPQSALMDASITSAISSE